MATAIAPSPANLYLVDFVDTKGSRKEGIKNKPIFSLLHSHVIKRFIPSNHSMVESFKKGAVTYDYPFHINPLSEVLTSIPLSDLLIFASVCKSFYLMVNSNSIWETKLKQLLPSVKSRLNSPFNTKQQFQIIFDRISKMKKPYAMQIKRFEIVVTETRNKIANLESGNPMVELEELLTKLLGKDHKQQQSAAPDSDMGRCIHACDLISKELDNQKMFENIIEGSEKIYTWENLSK